MISSEYLRFMQTLSANNAPENVQKLANIVLEHLDDIAPLGTSAGRRVQKIVELAQQKFNTASNKCVAGVLDAQANTHQIAKIKSLKVGPFRGFAKSETFDLDSQLVLIYGPNGTGKSSFCEALEYGLLGLVEDAENKRFKETSDYLKNAHVGRFIPPEIKADIENTEGRVEAITVTPNETQFRFCFVEKNRIDNFSRIAAHTPARQTELISTLFGLDHFNDFVRGFSAEIDEKYIDTFGKKAGELAAKRQALSGEKKTITDNEQALIDLVVKEKTLADEYQKDMPFADFVLVLGSSEHPGEIQKLETDVQQSAAVLSGLKFDYLLAARTALENAISDLNKKISELAGFSENISYKQLYNAVKELTNISPDQCPACKTPIKQCTEDPFQTAITGLEKLQHLSVLEQERDDLKTAQHEAIKSLYAILKKACQLIGDEEQPNTLKKNLVVNESMLSADWWSAFILLDDKDQSPYLQLMQQIQQLEAEDTVASQILNGRQAKIDRLKQLRELHEQVIQLQTNRTTYEAGIAKANTAINAFEEANKVLIEAADAEKMVVAQNLAIFTAYSQLITRLNSYKDSLPGKLVADLGELVVQLYNAFNRGDSPSDLLADLKLPVSSGERIQISFRNAPKTYFDALHVLSEGHIRCVGLAILLAKNLKENCPILIFDDPVNAIDDEHREAIRRTLFEDDYFQGRQIILTCHGEEFFKDIQNLLGVERTKASKRLTFLPQMDGEKHIRIDFQSAPRNYVFAAQEHLSKLETRGALEKSRQALESLTKGKVWGYLAKHGDGNLSIKLRTASSPIELRNLTEQLKIKLADKGFTHEDKDKVLEPINIILGVNGLSREWRYLNKGTHEEADRAEFDLSTVKAIVDSLAALDSVLK